MSKRKNKKKKDAWVPSSKAREEEEKFLKRTAGGNFDRNKVFDEPRRESMGTAWGITKRNKSKSIAEEIIRDMKE